MKKGEAPCPFCDALVRFCRLENGWWIALDYSAVDEGGEYACVIDEARYIPKANREGKRLHRAHAETCVNKEERKEFYRQRRRAAQGGLFAAGGGAKRGA